MPRIHNKISDPQNDTKKINENFDRIALDIAERSGKFSSIATTNFSLATGTSQAVEVNVVDALNLYQINQLAAIPRLNMFLDNDDDYTYSWPLGANLAVADVHGISVNMVQSQLVINQVTNEKATIWIVVHNNSGTTHTFYLEIDVFYVPPPDLGIAQRTS